ncbi:MAG: CRISPR system precrRNA processing endoribonuclease RAMP protein Cas6 [Vicinamibacteria bacterium]
MVYCSDLVKQGDDQKHGLTLRFRTPTDLRDGGVSIRRPEFGPLVRRLRDRVAALSAFFGDGPLSLGFRAVGDAADAVELVEDRTRRVAVSRRSSLSGQRHDIGGFVGEAHYRGENIAALMPLIRLGEVVHVGKHAAFGNGSIEVSNG